MATVDVILDLVSHYLDQDSNMADVNNGPINSVAVLTTKNQELNVIKCISCAELELELVRTRTELKAALRIVEVLQEEVSGTVIEVKDTTVMGNDVRIGMEASTSDSQTNTQVLYCAYEKRFPKSTNKSGIIHECGENSDGRPR
jgi:hypothetical protein